MQDDRTNDTPGLRDAIELRLRDFVFATAIIAATTAIGYFEVEPLWPSKLPLLFFAAVLLAGYRLGMWPALAAAFLAFLAYNYFFEEPRFVLSFNAGDAFALTTFLIGASLVGGLTGRLSDHARRLKHALAGMTSLFEASRDLSVAMDPHRAVERVVKQFEAKGYRAAIWLNENGKPALYAASTAISTQDVAVVGERLAAAAGPDETSTVPALMRMATAGRQVGAAALWPARKGELPDPRWTRALLDLTAVATDRARLIAEIAEARVVAEKEGLRTALLSSLSHDLRTPLSTILASATSLLEYEDKFDAATRRDLLTAIQDESERLNRYLANLLEMTRLESGALQIGRYLIDPREAMAAALQRMGRRLAGRRVAREFAAGCGHVDVDPMLLEQALANIIENAVAHTRANSLIVARVEAADARVLLAVDDDGDGIAPGDLPHVFDKFFRGGGDRRRGSGIGLGLAVTRGLIEAFGGAVRAVSPVCDGRGTRFEIDLPSHRIMETSE